MSHVTSIGLDVHARSITAVALDSVTGEVRSQRFGYSPAEVADWILQFESPKAVCESGVTGFHLVRALGDFGIDCVVGAVPEMVRPSADKRKENDRSDAGLPARRLLARNIVEVFALVAEVGAFSRFGTARSFASWLGLAPSERSSGERVSRGGITKAGNSHLRKLLVEASWHYTRATKERKRGLHDDAVPAAISNHAASGARRLVERRRHLAHDLRKRPVVANIATARELACWIWALGRMSEGTLS